MTTITEAEISQETPHHCTILYSSYDINVHPVELDRKYQHS